MYILTRPELFPSARVLSQELTRKTNKRISVTTSMKREPPLIRWGNATRFEGLGGDTEFNDRGSILYCGSKLRLDRFLSENTFIPHVEYHSNVAPERYPVVVRTILNGSGGVGIVICKNSEEFAGYRNDVWSYWYNFSYELGVHVLGGEISRVFKKLWKKDEPEPEFPIKNTDKDYSFSLRSLENYKKLSSLVDEFYDLLPINMTRLDVGWDRDVKCYRIIEANSAPSLVENQNTLNVYVDFLMGNLPF